MTKLEQLVARCNGCVHVTANDHKTGYGTVSKWVKDNREIREFDEDDEEVLVRCVEAGIVWEIVAYPRTPIGSYQVYGPTMDEALDAILELIPEHEDSDG